MYNKFAYYYDSLMSNIDYEYFAKIVKKYLPIDSMLLDAGCGTGSLTTKLYDMGYSICGIDKSVDMLKVFNNKLINSKRFIKIYEGSIEEEISADAFTGVISFFDVMNYVDYKKAFRVIYDSLKVNGIFIFDVYQTGYINSLIGYQEQETFDDFKYKWSIEAGKEINSIVHIISIDDEFEEKHYQKTYSKETYQSCLEKIGFEVSILEESNEEKIYFLCKKKIY